MYRIDHTALLKQKKGPVLDITGFFFRMSIHVKAEVRSTKAVTLVRMRKKNPVLSNTGKFICFNNNVSNLYNNSVVEKIYGLAYIFTILMFRKSNKTTINKIKRQIVIGQRSFGSRLYLDISRSFKCHKC